jgi:hypothetical protein
MGVGGVGGWGVSSTRAWPHWRQNLAVGGLACLHWVQTSSVCSVLPQAMQNLALSGSSVWQLGHFTESPSFASKRSYCTYAMVGCQG